MKKILCVLLALVMLLGIMTILSGCKDSLFDGLAETEKAYADEDSDGVATLLTDLAIVENGVSNYVLVYPSVPTASEKDAANIIRDNIKKVTDVYIKVINEDFIDEEEGMKFIYVGDTDFDPAEDAKEDLVDKGYTDAYVIGESNGDIYFVGASDAAIVDAANYYVDNLIEKNYNAETKTLCFEGASFSGARALEEGFSPSNIREYSIIYDADGLNMSSMAKSLQSAIESSTGFAPSIYADTDTNRKEQEYEILLGETNRELSKRCYENTASIMEYQYVVGGSKLQLVIGGCYSGQKCIEDIGFRMLRDKDATYEAGSYHKTDFAEVTKSLTSGADIRIMSANVLAYRWGEEDNPKILPVAQRAEIFVGALLNYLPDAVGVQETDEPWQQALPWYLKRVSEKEKIEYTYMFDTLTHEGREMINFSSIVYRSDLYKLDDSGAKVFSIWTETPKYFQRVATYVKLTSKTDSNKEFVLVNTHWAHESREIVNACAVEQAELVNSLKAKYPDVTVFCTGDYNNLSTREWRDEYLNKLVWNINGKIASQVAKENGVLITNGGCRGSAEKTYENAIREVDNNFIDHIIMSGAACEVKRHDTIRENRCIILTDHSLIYADIDLK